MFVTKGHRTVQRRTVLRGGLAALAGTALAACAPDSRSALSRLVLAVQPTATAATLSADAKELATRLGQRLGRGVEIVFPTTYGGVIESLRFGHAAAGFMSAWPALLAQKHAGATVDLAEVREVVIGQDKVEKPFYYSYWVVRKDSPAARLTDLRGKRAAFPSNLSTSGYVAPLARMIELGLVSSAPGRSADPSAFFGPGNVVFAGGYQQGWEALKAGQVDATVIAGDVSESLYREVLANTRVVEQQGPIPSHAVVLSKELDGQTREQLVTALLELGTPELRPLMRKFISGIFVGFQKTTGAEHLGALDAFLGSTQLAFVETLPR
ncbi:MAG: phosphate/phosphite/phosphonate ABC transporter substrate-binding protein [Chloroflexi bacterium]|nr:phosphate/phosphite/phosphonate ABC transporter substrate-binding protein [Chloroflexota bacterium]